MALLAAGCAEPPPVRGTGTLRVLEPAAGDAAWAGLLKPVALDVAPDGRVHVADQGDRTVKVYGPDGRRAGRIGGRGEGPGELTAITDLEAGDESVSVLDGTRRLLLRLSPDGRELGRLQLTEMEETVASLGSGYVLASSPGWTLPSPGGAGARPLFRVVDRTGRTEFRGGERAPAGSPFTGHILNFVLPAGSPDGRLVWLARLNGTSVSAYVPGDGTVRHVDRSVPFDWARIPDGYTPSAELLAAGEEPDLPFDPISLDIDTDGDGNAYVLTAVASGRSGSARESLPVAVDRIDARTLEWARHPVPEPATDLAVSPDGRRLYLLHEHTAELRVYTVE